MLLPSPVDPPTTLRERASRSGRPICNAWHWFVNAVLMDELLILLFGLICGFIVYAAILEWM